MQIYTWPDASLRELTDLVKEVQPAARRTTARLEFALIYPDKKGRNVMRVIGGAHSTRPGPDDIKTLKQLNFQACFCFLATAALLLLLSMALHDFRPMSWTGNVLVAAKFSASKSLQLSLQPLFPTAASGQ